jgi:hypothetical protein
MQPSLTAFNFNLFGVNKYIIANIFIQLFR